MRIDTRLRVAALGSRGHRVAAAGHRVRGARDRQARAIGPAASGLSGGEELAPADDGPPPTEAKPPRLDGAETDSW